VFVCLLVGLFVGPPYYSQRTVLASPQRFFHHLYRAAKFGMITHPGEGEMCEMSTTTPNATQLGPAPRNFLGHPEYVAPVPFDLQRQNLRQ